MATRTRAKRGESRGTPDEPMKVPVRQLKPSKLKPNMVTSGILTTVEYNGEHVKIERSWEEFILLMLSFIYHVYPDNYLKVLEQAGCLGQNFDVTRRPPSYNNLGNIRYDIPMTPYYLMTDMNYSAVIKAIQGFHKALDIEEEDILLYIEPELKLKKVGLSIDDLAGITDEIDLPDLLSKPELMEAVKFNEVYFFNSKIKAKDVPDATLKIIRQSSKKIGSALDIALKATSNPVCGVTQNRDITALSVVPIQRGKDYYYFTNGDKASEYQYLHDYLIALGVPVASVKFKVLEIELLRASGT